MSPSALDRKIYFSLVLVESVKNFCRPKSCKNFASKSLWITDFFSKGNFPISMTFLLFWGKWLDKSCWLSMIFTSYWWIMSGRVRTSNQYSNHGFFMKNDKNRYCPQNSSLFVLFMAIFAAEIFMHPHPKTLIVIMKPLLQKEISFCFHC